MAGLLSLGGSAADRPSDSRSPRSVSRCVYRTLHLSEIIEFDTNFEATMT